MDEKNGKSWFDMGMSIVTQNQRRSCCRYTYRYYAFICVNGQLDSRMSELSTYSVTEGWSPVISTDVVARHTAIFH